jgi:transposase InsO family protein
MRFRFIEDRRADYPVTILYLATVMDLYSSRIVGWAMDDHLRADLPLAALQMAISAQRPGAGLIHHSDRGVQTPAVKREAVAHLRTERDERVAGRLIGCRRMTVRYRSRRPDDPALATTAAGAGTRMPTVRLYGSILTATEPRRRAR